MSTLADEFLFDLEGDEDDQQQEEENQIKNDDDDDQMLVEKQLDEQFKKKKDEVTENIDQQLEKFAQFLGSDRLSMTLQRVDEASSAKDSILTCERGMVEHHPEYRLILDANSLTADIQNEMGKIFTVLKELYAAKFRDLEGYVMNPIDYARVVKRLGNCDDVTQVELNDLLPDQTVMVVRMAATHFQGTTLSSTTFQKVIDCVDFMLTLDEQRKKMVDYVESRMTIVAPNLSTYLGSVVAAKLISAAGSLSKLAAMPANSVAKLGAFRTLNKTGASSQIQNFVGFVNECDLVKSAPSELKQKAAKEVSGKAAILARVDQFGKDQNGQVGEEFVEEFENKMDKWTEPPVPKEDKPLPAPNEKPRKRRGGARARKMKERFAQTEVQKQANRVAFGTEAQETYRNTEKSLGMLGKSTGKVRLNAVDKGLLKVSKKYRAELKKQSGGGTTTISGLTTSLTFNTQGIQLGVNTPAPTEKSGKYFSKF